MERKKFPRRGIILPVMKAINKHGKIDDAVRSMHFIGKDFYPSKMNLLGLDSFTLCFKIIWMMSKKNKSSPIMLAKDTQQLIRHCMMYATMYFTEVPGDMVEGDQLYEPWVSFLCFQPYELGSAVESYAPEKNRNPLNKLGDHKKIDWPYNFNTNLVFKISPPENLIDKDAIFNKPIGVEDNCTTLEALLCHPIMGSYFQNLADEAEQQWDILYADSEDVVKIKLDDFINE